MFGKKQKEKQPLSNKNTADGFDFGNKLIFLPL